MRAAVLIIALLLVGATPARPQAGTQVGEAGRLLRAGRTDEARVLLHRAERARPRDPHVLAALARLYAAPPADRARALDYARRGLLRHPDHPDLLRARLSLALTDTAGARFERMETLRSLSRRLLRADARDPDALLACGLGGYDDVAWRIGSHAVALRAPDLDRRYRHAAACLDTLLADRADHDAARRLRLKLAVLLARPAEARRLADAWRAAAPQQAEAWQWSGLAAYLDEDESAAAEAFARYMDLLPPAETARLRDPAPVRPPGAPPADPEVFWSGLDPILSTPENERWTAHLARLALAEFFFGNEGGAQSARGALVVRYGLPDNAAEALSGYGTFASTEDGRVVAWDWGDFHIVVQDWFMSGQFKLYSPPARLFGGRDAPNDYVLIARTLAREMPERLALRQVRELGAVAAYVFADPAAPEVVVATAVEDAAPVAVYGVSDGVVTRAAPLGGGAPALHRLALAPGRYRLQAEGAWGSAWAVHQDSIEVPAPDGRLRLSTLVPAVRVEEGPQPGAFVRYGLGVVPAIEARYAVGAPLYLYAEAYGLEPGGDFQVEIVAERDERRRLLGRRPSSVAVRFPEKSAEATEARYYVLSTADLAPGRYTVRLRVEDGAGRTAEATCSVMIVETPEP